MYRQLLKELLVALLNAVAISALVFVYNFARYGGSSPVAYSVSISLFAVIIFASLFGTFVPMVLDKLKIDPAIATGPFVTITNDLVGMLIYMGFTVLMAS